MKKRQPKRGARKIKRKLSPEQKAKRKARMKKIGKAFLWLDPSTQAIMIAKLIRDKVKAKRAKRKADKKASYPEAEQIIDSLQNVVAAEAAIATGQSGKVNVIIQSKGESVTGVNPIDQVLDSAPSGDTLDNVAEAASEPSEVVSEDTGEYLEWAYAEGEIPSKISQAIAKAKAKARSLKSPAKEDALAQIADIEKELKQSYSTAKSVAKSADANDIAEVSAAIKKADTKAIAASVSSKEAAPEKAEQKPKDEKEALGEPTQGGVPKWVVYGGGALVFGGLLYAIFGRKGSESK